VLMAEMRVYPSPGIDRRYCTTKSAARSPEVDAGRAEQRDRGGAKGVSPHDPPPAQTLGPGHGDELLLHRGDEVAAQHAVVEREAAQSHRDRGQRQALEVGDPIGAEGHVGRRPGIATLSFIDTNSTSRTMMMKGGIESSVKLPALRRRSIGHPASRRDHREWNGDDERQDLADAIISRSMGRAALMVVTTGTREMNDVPDPRAARGRSR